MVCINRAGFQGKYRSEDTAEKNQQPQHWNKASIMDGAQKKTHLFELFEILPKKPVWVIRLLDTQLHDTVFEYSLNIMFFHINFALP